MANLGLLLRRPPERCSPAPVVRLCDFEQYSTKVRYVMQAFGWSKSTTRHHLLALKDRQPHLRISPTRVAAPVGNADHPATGGPALDQGMPALVAAGGLARLGAVDIVQASLVA